MSLQINDVFNELIKRNINKFNIQIKELYIVYIFIFFIE